MEEMLNDIGIHNKGYYTKNGVYIIDLDNDHEWGVYYSTLSNNDDVEELQENSFLNSNASSLLFRKDNYQLNLQADFNGDIYKLIVSEI